MSDNLLYSIALSMLSGVGPIKARNLISYVGSPEAVFKESKSKLQKIPGIGEFIASKINFKDVVLNAEQELKHISDNKIKPIFYLDANYPKTLAQHDDSPLVLYTKGDIDFNKNKFISIVGTRSMSHYGNEYCNKLVADIASQGFSPVIVSGMAYGVDYCAHSAALKNSLKTIAVLGNGLSTIYPSAHRELSEKIIKNGALVTEFPFNSKIDAANFVKRNRIIAAMSEATIVVESAAKGGSLITAEYAVQYARDVYAFPGRIGDKNSEGCNFLIKTNRAGLIESADDLIYNLSWEKTNKPQQNSEIFIELTEDEQKIIDVLKKSEVVNVDVISYETKLPINKVLAALFNLEFNNVVKSLPGRMYSLLR